MESCYLYFAILIFATNSFCYGSSVWSYECRSNRCLKVEHNTAANDGGGTEQAISLPVCRLFCTGVDRIPGTLWPKPSGPIRVGTVMAHIDLTKIKVVSPVSPKSNIEFWTKNEQRLLQQVTAKVPKRMRSQLSDGGGGKSLVIGVSVSKPNDARLTQQTNESYTIEAKQDDGVDAVVVNITAVTIFGARHALETLSQLIVFDDIRMELQVLADFNVIDRPAYPHRGLLLDTARNYFSVDAIKRTIGKRRNRRMQTNYL